MADKCPRCDHELKETDVVCPNCGISLLKDSQATITTDSAAIQQAILSGWGARKTGWKQVVIYIQDVSTPIIVEPGEEYVIGRAGGGGDPPDLDLTPHGAAQKGVSRRHAALRRNDEGGLYLIDLGSKNGTYLNETQISPNRPNPLADGDAVRLGTMLMHIYFK